MKKLFSLLLCFQILCIQNFVLAQGEDVEIPEAPEITTIESDAAGFNSEEQSYSRVNEVYIDDIVSMLTNMVAVSDGSATGAVCGTVLSPDLQVHAIGAIAYIGLSIVSTIQMKKANNEAVQDTVTFLGDSVADSGALESLKAVKEFESQRKKALVTKTIGLGVFTASLIVADIIAVLKLINNAVPAGAAANALGVGKEIGCTKGSAPLIKGAAIALVSSLMSGQDSAIGGSDLVKQLINFLPAVIGYIDVLKSFLHDTSYASRIVYHSIILALTGTTTGITIGKISKTQDNIDDVEKIISDYEAQTNSNETPEIDPDGSNNTSPGGAFTDPVLSADRDLNLDFNNNPTIQELKTKIKLRSIGPDSYNGISSPTLVSSINTLNQIPKDFKNGNIAGIRAGAESLQRSIGKLTKVRDGLREKLNERLVASGKKPIDFASRASQAARSIQDQTKAQVASAFNKDPNLAKALSEKTKDSNETVQKVISGVDSAVTVAPVDNAAIAQNDESFDDLFSEDFDNQLKEAGELSRKQESLADYELAKNDIYKGSSQSIFKVLSVRYLKTAYPKLLEEKK